jgi:hypothetical protein
MLPAERRRRRWLSVAPRKLDPYGAMFREERR